MQRLKTARLLYQDLNLFRFDLVAAALMLFGLLLLNALVLFEVPGPIEDMAALLGDVTLVLGAIVGALGMSAVYGMRKEFHRAALASRAAINATNTDPLTGAYSRAYFLVEFEALLKRKRVAKLGYIQLDMDNLKLMNDGSGHAAGDVALSALITKVRNVVPNALYGRLGGDEFGIALTGVGDKADLEKICAQIQEELSRPVAIEGRNVRIGATMGYAAAPVDAQTIDELMSCADLALYEGKSKGRGMAIGFDREMLREKRQRRFIERELRAAILMNQLTLHYQPIFDLADRSLLSYEALVRWEHPVRGLIPPSDFIPIAERSDLIDRLGEWVLRRACAELVLLETPALSVNASVVQLRRPDFAQRVQKVLLDTGTRPEQLTIEVTETVPLDVGGVEVRNLEALRSMGLRVAIDDFGAGNASVSYLKRFSFDTVKIDRSYIIAIAENGLDSMMVEAISRIGKAMNMLVIAEGVETEEQLEAVRALGCTAVQGYLLGRPQPIRTIVHERRAHPAAA